MGFGPFDPSCDHFPISILLTNGETNGGLKFNSVFPKLIFLLTLQFELRLVNEFFTYEARQGVIILEI